MKMNNYEKTYRVINSPRSASSKLNAITDIINDETLKGTDPVFLGHLKSHRSILLKYVKPYVYAVNRSTGKTWNHGDWCMWNMDSVEAFNTFLINTDLCTTKSKKATSSPESNLKSQINEQLDGMGDEELKLTLELLKRLKKG